MKIMNQNLEISSVRNMMLLAGLHVATFWVRNAVLERGIGLTMLLGCPHGWCQWAGMETFKQAPWCTFVLHSHAPQFCVHPRSKVPQRGSGFLCWGQTTYCAGIKPVMFICIPAEHLLKCLCPYLYMKQLANHRMDLHEMWYWKVLLQFIDTFQL
jgi:hypothetical protein